MLPNGHVLVPENGNNRVVEHDANGRVIWEVPIDQPIAALRLPNGNTLVTSMNTDIGAVEIDRTGKTVWQFKATTRVTRALRRWAATRDHPCWRFGLLLYRRRLRSRRRDPASSGGRSMRQLLLATLFTILPVGMVSAAGKPWYEDAPLHAVQFVDKNEGWAVGDEGVIWHTIDGGKNWERQNSGVAASLRAIHFLNPYSGWVVGRIELSGGRTEGVVLVTNDGGEKWQRAMHGTLPGLNGVRFVREREGYLFGDGSETHPSGVFRTADGGRTWHPLPGSRTTTWRAGWFTPTGEAALGGAWNRLASVKNGRVVQSEVDSLGGRAVTGVYFHGKQGLAVGQGGLILHSDGSLGATWSFVELKGLEAVRPVWDLHGIHGQGDRVWAVGRPGSVLLHSPDFGKTWQVQRTGQNVPLNGVFFLDEKIGYAVGELGTILTTQDGGKTWRLQRRGGQRAAVLSVHARPERIPLDTLATLGGQEGYLSVALQLVAPDSNSAALARSCQPFKVAAGARTAGGAAGEMLWAFPMPSHLTGTSADAVVQAWNRLHGDRANDHLLGQMVLALRMWRPNLVLADGPHEVTGLAPLEERLLKLLEQAVTLAGDEQAYPEQLRVLNLEPWRPAKVYSLAPTSGKKQVVLDTTEFTPSLGTTARDQAALASTALLGEEARYPTARAYRLISGPADGDTHRHLMQGIDLARGGLARRTLVPTTTDTEALQKTVQQLNTFQALVENPSSELTDANRLMGRLGPLLDKLPGDLAARTACQLGGQLVRAGQWALAREVYQLVVERYPAHPQTVVACRWLMQYHASSEARRRHDLRQFIRYGEQEAGVVNGTDTTIKQGQSGKGLEKDLPVPKTEIIQAAYQGTLTDRDGARRWCEGTLALEKQLAVHGPLHALDPAVQMALLSVKRRLGDIEGARKGFALVASRQPDGPWKTAAQAELWLLDRTGESPRPQLASRLTERRPILDGKLDDPCWEAAQPAKLRTATGDVAAYPTEVRVAHDAQHLYVAVKCTHPTGKAMGPTLPRQHDQDLRPYDRVSLILDLDRDYATAFHLQVDQRGCVADDCWGDRAWNPRWFVARHHDDTSWTVELAIPLEGLTGEGIHQGTIWACNVVRTTPGVGVQALSLPAEAPEEALRPEGLGLLLFTEPGKKGP